MKTKGCITATCGAAIFVVLFMTSENFIQGINDGLLNCVRVIIPCVFPFFIASALASGGELPHILQKILNPITRFLFRLPAECVPAVILGQLGGYLSGTKSAQSLESTGILSKSQSERLMLFCINPGVGFCVNAVGNAMLPLQKAADQVIVDHDHHAVQYVLENFIK